MKTTRPRCPLPEPLTADPLDHRVYADALEECGRDREAARARRTALALERGVRAALVCLGPPLAGSGMPTWCYVCPGDGFWKRYPVAGWRAPRGFLVRERVASTPWQFPGLPETRPDLVRDFLRYLARRVRLPNP